MDMDNKIIEKGHTEESGGIFGWKSGVLHELKDQLEKQRKLRYVYFHVLLLLV